MSTMTPRQKQEAAAALKRARATRAGKPLRRGSFPGTLPDPFIVFSSGRDLMISVPDGLEDLEPRLTKATSELLHTAMCLDTRTVVFPDRTDWRLAQRMVSKQGTDVHLRAWTAIHSTSNPYSVRTLTAALSYSWWAPEDVDTEDVDAWSEAFGITAPDRHTMLRELARRASAVGSRFAHLEGPPSEVQALAKREARLISGSMYVGLAADCRLHMDIEKTDGAQSTLVLSDPGLLTHHEVDGSVSRMTDATDVGNNRFRFRLVSPFRSKAGRQAIITDGETSIPSGGNGIISTSFEDGSMFLVLEMRPRDISWVEQTKRSGRDFYIRDKPYDGFSKKPENAARWQKPKETPTQVQRDLPLDVILAGGPS